MQNLTELVTRAKQKDDQAIQALMDRVNQKGLYIALGYVKQDRDKACDILQESFIRAFSRLDQLENAERFDAWFYRILNHTGINATHVTLVDKNSSHFSELDYEDTNYEETLDDDTLTFQPKENFDYSELKEGMKEVLDALPIAQKEAVYMYYFEDLNAREIAEEFDTTEDTVRSRLRYAKMKMKEKIEEMESHGKSLRGVAPIPFLVWMLQTEAENVIPAQLTASSVMVGSSTTVSQGVTTTSVKTTATSTTAVAGKITAAKIAIGLLVGVGGVYATGVITAPQNQAQSTQQVKTEKVLNEEERQALLDEKEELQKSEKRRGLCLGIAEEWKNDATAVYYYGDIYNSDALFFCHVKGSRILENGKTRTGQTYWPQNGDIHSDYEIVQTIEAEYPAMTYDEFVGLLNKEGKHIQKRTKEINSLLDKSDE